MVLTQERRDGLIRVAYGPASDHTGEPSEDAVADIYRIAHDQADPVIDWMAEAALWRDEVEDWASLTEAVQMQAAADDDQ